MGNDGSLHKQGAFFLKTFLFVFVLGLRLNTVNCICISACKHFPTLYRDYLSHKMEKHLRELYSLCVHQEGSKIISLLQCLFVAFVMLHFTRLSNAQSQMFMNSISINFCLFSAFLSLSFVCGFIIYSECSECNRKMFP